MKSVRNYDIISNSYHVNPSKRNPSYYECIVTCKLKDGQENTAHFSDQATEMIETLTKKCQIGIIRVYSYEDTGEPALRFGVFLSGGTTFVWIKKMSSGEKASCWIKLIVSRAASGNPDRWEARASR